MEGAVFLLLIAVVIYFLPTIIACNRGHHSNGAIFALNLFVGWTFLGWVLSLVWSLTYVIPEVASQARVVPAPPRESVSPAVPAVARSHDDARPYRPAHLVAGVALFLFAVVILGALTGRQHTPAVGMRDVPRMVAPKAAPISASYVAPPPITSKDPPAIARPAVATSVDGAEKIKREAERVQWCRGELKKPTAQRSERAKRACVAQ